MKLNHFQKKSLFIKLLQLFYLHLLAIKKMKDFLQNIIQSASGNKLFSVSITTTTTTTTR
jgi:hypothetical protein